MGPWDQVNRWIAQRNTQAAPITQAQLKYVFSPGSGRFGVDVATDLRIIQADFFVPDHSSVAAYTVSPIDLPGSSFVEWNGAWEIVGRSAQVKTASATSQGPTLAIDAKQSDNILVECFASEIIAGTASRVFLRGTDKDNFICFQWNPLSGLARLFSIISGVSTIMDTATASAGTTARIGIQVSGTSIIGFLNGTPVVFGSSTFNQNATFIGMNSNVFAPAHSASFNLFTAWSTVPITSGGGGGGGVDMLKNVRTVHPVTDLSISNVAYTATDLTISFTTTGSMVEVFFSLNVFSGATTNLYFRINIDSGATILLMGEANPQASVYLVSGHAFTALAAGAHTFTVEAKVNAGSVVCNAATSPDAYERYFSVMDIG